MSRSLQLKPFARISRSSFAAFPTHRFKSFRSIASAAPQFQLLALWPLSLSSCPESITVTYDSSIHLSRQWGPRTIVSPRQAGSLSSTVIMSRPWTSSLLSLELGIYCGCPMTTTYRHHLDVMPKMSTATKYVVSWRSIPYSSFFVDYIL